MKKILKDNSWVPMGEEGSSLAIALFFFLLCSILCAGMLGMGLSRINSAHTFNQSADNLDVNAMNPSVRSMIARYINQIKDSGVRYYPEYNCVNTHSDNPIGYVVEDLCNTVHETNSTASRTLTVIFDDATDDLSLPMISDGRYGFELVIMMDTDYDISLCVYDSESLVRIAMVESVFSDEEFYEWCDND